MVTVFLLVAAAAIAIETIEKKSLTIIYPLEGAVFPPDIAAPTLRWKDQSTANTWQIRVVLSPCDEDVLGTSNRPEWRPSPDSWERTKACATGQDVTITVFGVMPDETSQGDEAATTAPVGAQNADTSFKKVSQGTIDIHCSTDPVQAPIFFREVPLPFSLAASQRWLIRWRVGQISSPDEPRTVLENMFNCVNCHSFSADGKTLAMDVDYGQDKGTYAIAEIEPVLELNEEKLITWRDFRREDEHRTFGLLSQISPDGRYVVSTVKEVSVLRALPDLFASQLFFPVRGILVVYDRHNRRFFALPGADDPNYVQTNPTWSPDGETLIFARAPALDAALTGLPKDPKVIKEVADQFVNGERGFRYDLYRIPFNGGKGGVATPLMGAHGNGLSNYFARYSPNGEWVVFCQAANFMFSQPDSRLLIVPSQGGTPRPLVGNAPSRMNSWHSWSPNGRWLVYASKANGPYTQLWLTHIDSDGNDSPPVLLEQFTPPDRAANLPEFMNSPPGRLLEIRVSTGVRGTHQ